MREARDIADDVTDLYIEATTEPASVSGALITAMAACGAHPVINRIISTPDGRSIFHFRFVSAEDATRAQSHLLNPGDVGSNQPIDQLHVRTMDGKVNFAHRFLSPAEAIAAIGADDFTDADGDVFVESAASDHMVMLHSLRAHGHAPIAHQVIDTNINRHNVAKASGSAHVARHVSHFQYATKAAADRARQHLIGHMDIRAAANHASQKQQTAKGKEPGGVVKVAHHGQFQADKRNPYAHGDPFGVHAKKEAVILTAEQVRTMIGEEKWSADVSTKWHPPAGTFDKSGEDIAKTLLAAGKHKAAKRLAFYTNRAGKNLDQDAHARLGRAKAIIQKHNEEGVQHESANPAIGLAAAAVRIIG